MTPSPAAGGSFVWSLAPSGAQQFSSSRLFQTQFFHPIRGGKHSSWMERIPITIVCSALSVVSRDVWVQSRNCLSWLHELCLAGIDVHRCLALHGNKPSYLNWVYHEASGYFGYTSVAQSGFTRVDRQRAVTWTWYSRPVTLRCPCGSIKEDSPEAGRWVAIGQRCQGQETKKKEFLVAEMGLPKNLPKLVLETWNSRHSGSEFGYRNQGISKILGAHFKIFILSSF